MSDISVLAGYLKANDPPTAEEVQVVQAYIKNQTEIAQSIADKLYEIDRTRKLLQDQLDECNQSIKQHRAVISPIRRFPDDVLVSIFETLLAHEGLPTVTISHVCHGWRNLALNAPSLWTKIAVSIDPHRHPHLGAENIDMLPAEDLAVHTKEVEKWKQGLCGKYKRVVECIRRSGQSALSISFETSEFRASPYNTDFQHLYTQLIDALIPTSPRWEYLNLNIKAAARDSVLIRLLQIPPANVPKVKTLRLKVECQGDSAWLSRWGGMGMGGDLPLQGELPMIGTVGALLGASLTDLVLRNISAQVLRSRLLPARWRSLTRLTFEQSKHPPAFSQIDAMSMMASCPKLVECNMCFATQMDVMSLYRTGDQLLPDIRVTLPDLKILRFSGESPIPQDLPAKMDLPSLGEFSIDFSKSASTPTDVARSVHAEWIGEHGAKMTTVTMDYISVTPAALVHCLERLPNVVNLTLLGLNQRLFFHPQKLVRISPSPHGAAVMNDELLARLTPHFDETGTEVTQTCLCPKLRRLECRMGALERNEGAMLKMILARYGDGQKKTRGLVRRIEEVALHYNRPQSVDIVKDLEGSGVDAFHLALKVSYAEAPDRNDEELGFDIDF